MPCGRRTLTAVPAPGAEVISIKELLGHASIGSSERYAKLSNQRVKEVYRQTIRKVIAKTRV